MSIGIVSYGDFVIGVFYVAYQRLKPLYKNRLVIPSLIPSVRHDFVNTYHKKIINYTRIFMELGINSNTSSNTTYKPISADKDEILANHRSFITSLNIPSGKEYEDLPYLYSIPKLHKTPYKE